MTDKTEEQNDNFRERNYFEERKVSIDAEREAARSFDKAILTLSAGAFGLSFTFITKIAPDYSKDTLKLIYLAWILFIASMCLTLINFLLSQKSCAVYRRHLDIWFKNDKKAKKLKNKMSCWVNFINYFTIILFILGTIFMASFSSINLYYKKKGDGMTKKEETKKEETSLSNSDLLINAFSAQELPKIPRTKKENSDDTQKKEANNDK